ncbi:hypothetical protein F0562_010355 [Nyssa sinensis]|uniref:ETFB lysine methyltransferase n=1 Tax=Nyssa sinensis TaxID=561372 RepID=A0A5J5A2C3_9ASTE|nr:hypothetical protein F0562_010355 [Nyssa sinensis]
MSLCSLRRHFFKHLSYTSTFFTHRIHHINSNICLPSRFSPPSSAITEARAQWRHSSITAMFSTSSSATPTTCSFASPYLSVHIRCRKDVADVLSEALLCFGASSTSMDEEDSYEPDDEVYITSIFSDCQDVDECISHAADSIGLKEMPTYEVMMGNQSDWIKKTQESFHPVEVTEGLWIVPEWRTPPDPQATNIILNPGLAFGTGEHPTTKLCLLLLHGLIKGGELFLDYGTGSGILAIAALKFGAALSVGFDVDPQAITSACQNASLNNIGPEQMQLHLVPSKSIPPFTDEMKCVGVEGKNSYGDAGGISETEKYDVVIANILLNPLLDLAEHIVSCAKPGAAVGVSGIISEQLPHIIERYSPFLEGISVSKIDDWACVSGTKKRNITGS